MASSFQASSAASASPAKRPPVLPVLMSSIWETKCHPVAGPETRARCNFQWKQGLKDSVRIQQEADPQVCCPVSYLPCSARTLHSMGRRASVPCPRQEGSLHGTKAGSRVRAGGSPCWLALLVTVLQTKPRPLRHLQSVWLESFALLVQLGGELSSSWWAPRPFLTLC